MLKILLPIGSEAAYTEEDGWRSKDAVAEIALNSLTEILRGPTFDPSDRRGGVSTAGLQYVLKQELLAMPGVQLLEETPAYEYESIPPVPPIIY